MSSVVVITGMAAAFAMGGCGLSEPRLTATQSPAKFEEMLRARCVPGMTREQIDGAMDELHVSRRTRLEYPATGERAAVYLVRVFESGGVWVTSDDDVVEWVDVCFVMDSSGERCERIVLFRDGVRYFRGDPVGPPRRRAAGPVPRYPGSIPPPADPLEGTR